MKIRRGVIRFLCLFGLWLGVGLQAHAQTDTVTYVYTDPQGTPLVKADASGNVIARYDYTPYGNSVTSLGAAPNGPGYTGHVSDPETGLVYMQARYYQPTGRFPSPDPVRPVAGNIYSFNRYAYANNNPIANIDPTGMFPGDTGDCSNSAYPCQVQRFSYSSSQGGIFHVAGNALAADIAWLQGWATGDEALQKTAIEGMQKEFNGRTASEAVVSLLMTSEGGEDSFEMQEVPSNTARSVESGTGIVQGVAQQHASSGPDALMDYMTRGEQAAYLENPDAGSRFLGQAVHNATADSLQQIYGNRFIYSRIGPDFLDTHTGELIELTTPGEVSAHMARPGYRSVNYATYSW